ncbi:MAG TPA: hypothetical protein VFX78_00030 [Candidatus Eisenbacteria bacterium]|nr:hypothetical protein [Candidatus Eisenbacteria bacterium]
MTVDGRTVWISAAFVPKPDNPPVCQKRQLNRAITYYRTAYRQHREAMWLEGPVSRVWYHDCDTLKRRAVDWRDRADVARIEYIEWHVYQYNWRDWLPWHWYRVGSCETGSGGPPNWRHSNSQYQGAFGFAISSWDDYVGRADPKAGPYPSEAYLATPRQQYEVALAIYRQYGMSGWGCKG